MNFFGTLIAVLLALYLTGNIQDGSILLQNGNIFVQIALILFGIMIVVIFGFIIVRSVYDYGKSPRKLWDNFKSGKLKF